MASMKAEGPLSSHAIPGQAKKEPVAKARNTLEKAPASRPAAKKGEQKPKEPKKRVKGCKPAAKD